MLKNYYYPNEDSKINKNPISKNNMCINKPKEEDIEKLVKFAYEMKEEQKNWLEMSFNISISFDETEDLTKKNTK